MRKFTALMLSVCFLLCLIPANAFAAEEKEAKIEISRTSGTMSVGQTVTLKARVSGVERPVIGWGSSDSSVVSVNRGVITAHKPGTAVIAVRVKDTNLIAQCKITVRGSSSPPAETPPPAALSVTPPAAAPETPAVTAAPPAPSVKEPTPKYYGFARWTQDKLSKLPEVYLSGDFVWFSRGDNVIMGGTISYVMQVDGEWHFAAVGHPASAKAGDEVRQGIVGRNTSVYGGRRFLRGDVEEELIGSVYASEEYGVFGTFGSELPVDITSSKYRIGIPFHGESATVLFERSGKITSQTLNIVWSEENIYKMGEEQIYDFRGMTTGVFSGTAAGMSGCPVYQKQGNVNKFIGVVSGNSSRGHDSIGLSAVDIAERHLEIIQNLPPQ